MFVVLSESLDATANYLCSRFAEHQIPLLRVDTDRFAERGFVEYTSDGGIALRIDDVLLGPETVTAVIYRRPRGISVEGPYQRAHALHASREWGAALDCFLAHVDRRRWINHPALNAHASNKLLQLTRARELGLQVPDTLVTRSPSDLQRFWSKCQGEVVVKPLSVGFVESAYGDVEGQIFTSIVEEEHLHDADAIALCPTLFQERIRAAVDVRVTLVDGMITALSLLPAPRMGDVVDIRKHGLDTVVYEPITVPSNVADLLLRLVKSFELRFAAIDLMKTVDGQWVFLEINPNGQWAWMDLLGVSDIARTFIDSALRAS